jgi:hypothetical protein
MVRLTLEQRQSLHDALLHAYPNRADFKTFLMLQFGQDRSFDRLTESDAYPIELLNIIVAAEAQGWLNDLVSGAIDARPDFPTMQRLGADLGITPSGHSNAAEAGVGRRHPFAGGHRRRCLETLQELVVDNHPFVDRQPLRAHLTELIEDSHGGQNVFLINGAPKSGKSHSLRLIRRCVSAGVLREADPNMYAEARQRLDAAQLWLQWVGRAEETEDTIPGGYDRTKEAEQVPKLLRLMIGRLGVGGADDMRSDPDDLVWLVLDHCRSPALSEPALMLIGLLAREIEKGNPELRHVRLVLVDMELTPGKWPSELPEFLLRVERAQFPNTDHLGSWLRQLASQNAVETAMAARLQVLTEELAGLLPSPADDDAKLQCFMLRLFQIASDIKRGEIPQ